MLYFELSILKLGELIMNAWYRRRLKEQIPSLMEKWQGKMGVEVDSWVVKQMKTKWGTCNIESKRILFNLELVKEASALSGVHHCSRTGTYLSEITTNDSCH